MLSSIGSATATIKNNNILNTQGNGQASSGGLSSSQVGYGILNLASGMSLDIAENYFSGNLKGECTDSMASSVSFMIQRVGENGASIIGNLPGIPRVNQNGATVPETITSIFDILHVKFVSTGITNQQDAQIQYSVQKTTMGDIAGGIKIVGFKNQIIIDNQTYIPDENSAIVKYNAVMAPRFDFWNVVNDKIDNRVTVTIEDGTAKARLDVTMKWYTVSVNQKTKAFKKDYHVSTASFNDTAQAPQILRKQHNVTGYVDVYPSETYPVTQVNVPHNDFTQRIEYRYGNTIAVHTFLVGEQEEGDKGIKHTIYSRVNRWDGNLSCMDNEFIIDGPFNTTELSMTYYTPYKAINVTDIKVNVHELQTDTWKVPQLGFILRLFFMLLILLILFRIIFF